MNFKIIILILFILYIPIISFSKYISKFEIQGKANVAEPVIVIEEADFKSTIVNKKTFPIEYKFTIKNYIEDKINEIEFYYNIEVQAKPSNFPIKYTLIDVENEEDIILNGNKTDNLKILKEVKEEKNYMLLIEWDEKDGELSNETKLIIKINVEQRNEERSEEQ